MEVVYDNRMVSQSTINRVVETDLSCDLKFMCRAFPHPDGYVHHLDRSLHNLNRVLEL